MDHASVLKELFTRSGNDAPTREGPVDPAPDEADRTRIRDDKEALDELFLTPAARPSGPSARRPSRLDDPDWPVHNYNEAYGELERRHPDPRRRRRSQRGDSVLWEIQELLEGERSLAPVKPASPANRQVPWPARGPAVPVHQDSPMEGAPQTAPFQPDEWLNRLAGEEPEPVATEAHLVRTLLGDPPAIRVPLFDTSETLYTREATRHRGRLHRSPGSGWNTAAAHPRPLARITGGRRGWILKTAGVVLGLKVGLALGYVAAALL